MAFKEVVFRSVAWQVAGCLLILAGCGTAGLGRVRVRSGAAQVPAGPAILVDPVVFALDPGQEPWLRQEEATQLLLQALRSQGVPAEEGILEGAAYRLSCAVPRLGYAVRRRFPRQTTYEAELACSIYDQVTHALRWKRNLTARYEETTVLNTMTKLPVNEEPVLLRESVLPLWNGMAYSVKLFLNRPPLPARREPAASADWMP